MLLVATGICSGTILVILTSKTFRSQKLSNSQHIYHVALFCLSKEEHDADVKFYYWRISEEHWTNLAFNTSKSTLLTENKN